MAAAFHAGAEAIQVFSDLDELLSVSEHWPSPKRIRAGERGGRMVKGFDLGNSPLDHSPDRTQGKRLFMSTTNGTRCLQRIQDAPLVLTAALTTRQATVDYLLSHLPNTVWLVGSGWEGEYSLEDTVCAGAIVQAAMAKASANQAGKDHSSYIDIAGNDAAIAASSLYLQWQNQLSQLLHHASHGQRLLEQSNTADIDYCAQLDILDIVPIQQSPGILVRG